MNERNALFNEHRHVLFACNTAVGLSMQLGGGHAAALLSWAMDARDGERDGENTDKGTAGLCEIVTINKIAIVVQKEEQDRTSKVRNDGAQVR